MPHTARRACWVRLLGWTVLAGIGLGVPTARAEDDRFRSELKPLLDRFCSGCHNAEKTKGGVDLSRFADAESLVGDRRLWQKVVENVEAEIMPPEGQPAPTEAERAHLVASLQALISQVDCTIENPGRVTLRRLNRAEYLNTIRDLLGVEVPHPDTLPLDDVGYGFDTIGDVLGMSPMLLEKYLASAEAISERVLVVPRRFDGAARVWSAREMEGDAGETDDGRVLASNGQLTFRHDFPESGRYRLHLKVYGHQAGDEPVRMALRLDDKLVRNFDVLATSSDADELVADLAVARAGPRRISLAFLNDFYNPEAPDPGQRDRNLVVVSATLFDPPTPPLWPFARWGWRELQGGEPGDFGQTRFLTSEGEIHAEFVAPATGLYRLEVFAHTDIAAHKSAKMSWRIDGREVRVVEVTNTWEQPGAFSVTLPLGRGKHKVAFGYVDGRLDLHHLEVFATTPSHLPETHKRLLTNTPKNPSEWRSVARVVLEPLVARAYRRPARPEEVDRLSSLAEQAFKDGEPFERGIQLALQAVLVSPHFLYRVEIDRRRTREGQEAPPIRPLNDWELASRLSYFLWSSMPDEMLFQLARDGKLHEDATLEAQVGRMLKDPRARALVENFAGQWLLLRQLRNANPDPGRFPQFDEALRQAMQTETELFFQAVLQEDRPILDLLDSDFTFLNERLARHYGIENVTGEAFQRVALPADSPRGGVLTHASLLTLTSNPARTSPVKRGKYILEQILGTPPPPPPADVPPLADDDAKGPLQGTLRQRFEQHRSNPNCAVCHNKLDPLGFGFENFDAIGAWRDRDGDSPVDASGTLVGGRSFRGVEELKQILRAEKGAEFTRALTEKLMTYGIGRGLDAADACAVDAIVESLNDGNASFRQLITHIVKSDPFRKRAREEVNLQ